LGSLFNSCTASALAWDCVGPGSSARTRLPPPAKPPGFTAPGPCVFTLPLAADAPTAPRPRASPLSWQALRANREAGSPSCREPGASAAMGTGRASSLTFRHIVSGSSYPPLGSAPRLPSTVQPASVYVIIMRAAEQQTRRQSITRRATSCRGRVSRVRSSRTCPPRGFSCALQLRPPRTPPCHGAARPSANRQKSVRTILVLKLKPDLLQ
jgi:hypothetical protein